MACGAIYTLIQDLLARIFPERIFEFDKLSI